MTALPAAALRLALAERESYRLCLRAALDQLHAQQQQIDRQRRELADLRETWTRCARQVFGGAHE